MGGLPLVGDPDSVTRQLAELAAAGLTGIAVSFVNYLDELPYFCAEVLPRLARLGLREPSSGPNPTLGTRSQMSAPEWLTDLRSAASK
jgi:hypothetical protein